MNKHEEAAWTIAIGLKLTLLVFMIYVFFVPQGAENVRFVLLHQPLFALLIVSMLLGCVGLAIIEAVLSSHVSTELPAPPATVTLYPCLECGKQVTLKPMSFCSHNCYVDNL